MGDRSEEDWEGDEGKNDWEGTGDRLEGEDKGREDGRERIVKEGR